MKGPYIKFICLSFIPELKWIMEGPKTIFICLSFINEIKQIMEGPYATLFKIYFDLF